MHETTGRPTGQLLTARDGRPWWFDTGSLALDLAYTGGMDDDAQRELFRSAADLSAWLSVRFPEVSDAATDRDLTDARVLRGAVSRAASARSSGESIRSNDIDLINLFAATPDIAPSLSGGARQAGRSHARVSQSLSVLAREAVEIFAADPADRIRQCTAEGCGLTFYDGSRSNNRRWCSMQRCGNRAKVRAYRQRSGASVAEPPVATGEHTTAGE